MAYDAAINAVEHGFRNKERPGLDARREPIFNLPPMVTLLIAVFVLIHAIRLYFFDIEQDVEFLATFSFIPARFGIAGALEHYPGGMPAALVSTVSYALIHADWTHLIVNSIWLAAFGSAVERRFGARRFLAFSAVCAIAAAGAHYAFYSEMLVPVVGASGVISGHMAAAMRFVFQSGGPLRGLRRNDPAGFKRPALPLARMFADRRAVVFMLVFFAINLLVAATGGPLVEEGVQVAWQAHIGGFIAGIFLFPFFDPIGTEPDGPPAGDGMPGTSEPPEGPGAGF
ncbi:MAG: rhomboid family intramembrane serine protease [Hyphomicrobiales bacterium]|nr:rhomboid family intramembrane serine protease [Hyphomicrobiales bacterium]